MDIVLLQEPTADEHVAWMRRCLELARHALSAINPPVGTVLVKTDKPLGQGMEATRTRHDITCHAEIKAIPDALQRADANEIRGSTLYATHEPCLMCAYVIRHYQVDRVVVGVTVASVGGFSSAYPRQRAEDIASWQILRKSCRAYAKKPAGPFPGSTNAKRGKRVSRGPVMPARPGTRQHRQLPGSGCPSPSQPDRAARRRTRELTL